jgi:DNA-binding response OmpR family regulator
VVDDDSDFRELLKIELRLDGFDVMEATDGLSALRQLDARRPDVVVLDLQMPFVNGLEVREELAARPDTHNLPVIIVTGTDWPVPCSGAVIRKSESTSVVLSAVLEALAGIRDGSR